MNQLTDQELKTLREAEDILFNHIEYGMNNVFVHSRIHSTALCAYSLLNIINTPHKFNCVVYLMLL